MGVFCVIEKNTEKIIKKLNLKTVITFEEHVTEFAVPVQLYYYSTKEVTFIYYFPVFLQFCLDPDRKRKIPDPDPGKSSAFNRILIYNTGW